jgi:hypothetical protein
MISVLQYWHICLENQPRFSFVKRVYCNSVNAPLFYLGSIVIYAKLSCVRSLTTLHRFVNYYLIYWLALHKGNTKCRRGLPLLQMAPLETNHLEPQYNILARRLLMLLIFVDATA